jgi:hypothetical protein
VLDLIKDDLRRGISLGQICQGRPTAAGKVDRSLVRVRANVFYRFRELNPEFDQFVRQALANSNSRGQKIRWTRIRTSSVRDSNNDYYKIRDMIPEQIRIATISPASSRIVVTRLDRLARSTRDLLNLLDAVAKKGAGFRSLRDAWADTTSAHGRLM